MLKNWYIRRIQQRLGAHFRATCQRLNPAQFDCGAMRYNYKCHINAVHESAQDNTLSVMLVYCIDQSGWGFLHVINRTKRGRYIDHTLGNDWQRHQYFYVKTVLRSSYPNIDMWFEEVRKDFISLHSRAWLVKLLGIESIDVF